ncbi:DUF2913 family protein [Vibrio jasicida]|uniref:DUF2913 family protein n=1 Tax=Vibrio jasicida TaxID=766224 RepID=UPI003908FD59
MKVNKSVNYYNELQDLVLHSLLHLLCQVSRSKRYLPVAARNKILVKYLKQKLFDKSLSNLKKDIKTLVQFGKMKDGNLEAKLTVLKRLCCVIRSENQTAYN